MRGILVGLVAGLAVMGLTSTAHAAPAGATLKMHIQGAGAIIGGGGCDAKQQLDDRKVTDCSPRSFETQSSLRLTLRPAPALPGWTFAGWQGCNAVHNDECTVILVEDAKTRFPNNEPMAIYADDQAPDVKLVKLPQLNASAQLRPAFSSSEPGSTFACQVDRGGFDPCTSGDRMTFADGDHELQVKATDPSGNESAAVDETFRVDTVVPHLTILERPAPRVNSPAAVVAFRTSERTSNTCALDGAAPSACGQSFKPSNLADGPHRLVIVASDGINSSAPAVVEWTVDTAAPELTFEPMPDVTGTEVIVLWTVNEAATSTCSLDGAAAAPCANWFVAHDLAQGAHTLTVTVSDGLNTRTYTRSWMVVTIPPAVSTGG